MLSLLVVCSLFLGFPIEGGSEGEKAAAPTPVVIVVGKDAITVKSAGPVAVYPNDGAQKIRLGEKGGSVEFQRGKEPVKLYPHAELPGVWMHRHEGVLWVHWDPKKVTVIVEVE